MPTFQTYNVTPILPAALEPLREMSFNLWWTWEPTARRLFRPPLAPLASVVASALALLFIGLAFANDVAAWFADFAAINRVTLHVAPLLTCFCVLLWGELTAPGPAQTPATMPQAEVRGVAVATDA